jgi:UDP-N-acetylmuramoylalanine--D-glutamate ligase
MEKYKNKKIAVLGFGVEGMSVVDFLLHEALKITVFDDKRRESFEATIIDGYERKGVSFEFENRISHTEYDVIFRSPGIKPSTPELVEAKNKGIEVTSAIKMFFEQCPCEIIGVTGTKGKGTTSTLIYEMLKKEGFDAYLGGNIGIPPLSFLSELKGDSKVVLELSSFQLIDLEQSPHIGVILMTTSEHLDYHNDVYEYIEAKRNIFKFQDYKDFAVVNRDYPASNESDIYSNGKVYRVSREQDVDQGCFVKNDGIVLKMDGNENEILATKDLALRGKHNWENVCAATVAALCAGCSMKSIIPVLKSFKGLEHRIEHVATTRGVAYYDDSFSTTPETAIAAIEAFDEPKILILGGSSKNSNFSELGQIISESESIKAIIGIGVEWGRIRQEIKGLNPSIAIIEDCQTMEEIIQQCVEIGEIGDVVLLSPACASFDMFKSYKDRGDQFKEEVKKLIN